MFTFIHVHIPELLHLSTQEMSIKTSDCSDICWERLFVLSYLHVRCMQHASVLMVQSVDRIEEDGMFLFGPTAEANHE